MPKTSWRIIPDNITLSDPDNWQKIGKNRYRAERYFLAIVEEKLFTEKTSPPLISIPVPPGTKPVFNEKKVVVTTYTESITETIQNSVTSKIAAEASFKNSASLKEGLSAEVQTKLSTEISTALSSQLSSTKTYQVQSTHEVAASVAFESLTDESKHVKATYYLYLPLWPINWNLYLYRVESLELSFSRFTTKKGVLRFLDKVRDVKPLESAEPRLPLCRFSFYDPQEVFATNRGEYTPDVFYPDDIRVEKLTEECPELTVPEPTMSLVACAEVAFPESSDELKMHEQVKKTNKARKKPPLVREIERAERAMRGGSKKGARARIVKGESPGRKTKSAVKTQIVSKHKPAVKSIAAKRRSTSINLTPSKSRSSGSSKGVGQSGGKGHGGQSSGGKGGHKGGSR